MEPYVVDDKEEKKKKKTKKKKKKTTTASSSTADDAEAIEVVEMTKSKKPKSGKKPKSSRKPKSERKKSKKKQAKQEDFEAHYEEVTGYSYPVLEASGWEPLLINEINEANAKQKQKTDFAYAITGNESQIVTVAIPPGKSCKGEPGSMMYLGSHLRMSVSCEPNCFGRCCAGESCCALNFINNTDSPGYAGLVTNDPLAKVVPVEMGSPEVGGNLIVQSGAYMAHYGDVQIGMDCDCNLVRCCCGGMGLIRQKIEGTGTAFLGATGTIVQKILKPGETMIMDNNCILAYAESCKFDVSRTGGIIGMIGGGEGIFNASVTGPGLVVVQSMNMCMLLESLAADKIYRR